MASVNKAIVLGNLARDAETKYSADGAAITNVTVATNRTWKDKSGAKQEEVEFHRVAFFGRLAEIAGEYLKKGSPVYIEGRIKTRKWQDKDGQDRYTTEIIAESMQLLGARTASTDSATSTTSKKDSGGTADLDSDMPF